MKTFFFAFALLTFTALSAIPLHKLHEQHVATLDDFYDRITPYERSAENLRFLLEMFDGNRSAVLRKSELEALQAEMEYHDDYYGLNFEGAVQYGSDYDSADNQFFDQGKRYYAGLGWELLSDGYFAHQDERAVMEKELELKRLEQLKEATSDQLAGVRENINTHFAMRLETLMRLKQEFLAFEKQVRTEQYFLGKIKFDKIIALEKEYKLLDFRLQTYEAVTRGQEGALMTQQQWSAPAIVDIDMDRLLLLLKEGFEKGDERLLKEEIVRLENDKTQSRLKLYARKEGWDATNDYSAGVTLKIPLFSGKDELTRYRVELERSKAAYGFAQRTDAVRLVYLDYRNTLYDAIKLTYDIALTRHRCERALMRYRYMLGSDNLDAMVDQLGSLLSMYIEETEVHKLLYMKLAHLMATAGLRPEPEFFIPVAADLPEPRVREGMRSLYCWSEGFKGVSNETLAMLLQKKNVRNLIVSAGTQQDSEKLKRFMQENPTIAYELLIGDNSWVEADKQASVIKRLKAIAPLGNMPLHLDVEPQVFKDFKARKAYYQEAYLTMLQTVYSHKQPGQPVRIAIPMHFDPDYVERYARYTDFITVMAYGTKSPEVLKRRLGAFDAVKEELVVALNAKEFSTELELEQLIAALIDAGYPRITIHHLDEYIKLLSR